MNSKIDMSGYVDVATRIGEFRKKHPAGSLQPADLARPYTIERIGDQIYIVVVAAAYRDAEDAKPGIGMAYEPFPGRTPYTKGSELQNAETSAWGRAVVAVLAADTRKGVATHEDIRNREADIEAIESAKVETPEMTPEQYVSQLRGQCAIIGRNQGKTTGQLAAEYLDWSSGPEDPKGRDIATETDPNVLVAFQHYLRKRTA